MSLARKHKLKVLKAAEEGQPIQTVAATSAQTQVATLSGTAPGQNDKFAELKANLANELITLKAANGDEERTPYKKELIEKYRPFAESLMEFADWGNLDVLFWWLMWRLDVEGFEAVQPEWFRGTERGLNCPLPFKRDWQTMYVDELFNYTKREFEADQPFERNFMMIAIAEIESGLLVINAPLKSKLYKLSGQIHQKLGQDENALSDYEKALNYDEQVGVKTVIKELKAKLEIGEKEDA